MSNGVVDNGRGRYEMQVEDGTAFVSYRRADGIVDLLHAEVPSHLEGRGFGAQLVQGTLELARQNGDKVRPICSFVVAYFRRHPEYRDLLAP